MGGGLLELAAKGGQDVYLICNPQITFFKKVYKRHTNFSLEYNKFHFEGDADFGVTTKIIVPKKGDLVKNIFLEVDLPSPDSTNERRSRYVNYIGYALIDYIELYIGGTRIDRLTGEWMYIYNELSIKQDKKRGYNEMIGGKSFEGYSILTGNREGIYIIPLNFWFNKDTGLALPLVALQYHEVEIKIKFNDFNKLWVSNDGEAPIGNFKINECQIGIEYVYLDTKERKMFAQSNHEYLIKQTQYSLNNNILKNEKNRTIQLNFFHPIIELVWVVQNKSKLIPKNNGGNDYFNYSKTDNYPFKDTIKSAKIKLNGADRTTEMTAKELRFYIPIEKHTSIPDNFIYVYSFAINPESFQPSGSCNFSRFDNAQLEIEFEDDIEDSQVKIFALNYNVLRISKGMGGLAYIN